MRFLTTATTNNVAGNTWRGECWTKICVLQTTTMYLEDLIHFFTIVQELEIYNHILMPETRFLVWLLRICEGQHLNNLPHNFNTNTMVAGKGWIVGSQKLHLNLALWSPGPIPAARASGFNKIAVKKLFDILIEERRSPSNFKCWRDWIHYSLV